MYKMKADGVVFYDPSSDNTALQVLSPMAEFELNKAGSLTFTLPPGNVAYNSMQRMKTLVTLEQDGEVIFRGRVSETTTNLYKEKEVYCEGDLSFLLDSAVRPYKYEGSAASLLYQLVAQHNAQVESYKQFALGSVTAASGEMLTEFTSDACADTLSEIKTMLLDPFGGYLRVRYSGGTRYLDYIESYSASSGQAIEFGVNLVDLEDRYESADVFSVLVPLGAYYTEPVEEESDVTEPSEGEGTTEGEEGTEGSESTEGSEEEGAEEEEIKWVKPVKIAGMTTIEEVNGGSDSIVDYTALSKYGRIVKAHRWDDVTDPQELLDKGNELMSRMKDARTLTFTALDMHVINRSVDSIRLGDYVRLVSSPHGISMTDICSAIGLDIEKPHNSVYTFGVPPVTLTDINADAARQAAYANSHFHRWLSETDTTFEVAIQNLDLVGHRMNSVEFRMDAAEAEILLRAKQEDVDILGERIKQAEIRIDGAEAAIELKANQSEVDDLSARLSNAEILIDGANAAIKLKADQSVVDELGQRISNAEILIDGANAKIDLKADRTEVNALGERISNAEILIDGANAAIDLKADLTTVNDIASRMSSAEIKIDGLEAEIKMLATESVITDLAERISNAEIRIDGAEAAIEMKADQSLVTALGERVSQAEVDIDGANAQIALKANQSTVNALGNRMTQAEADIDGANAQIALKASSSTVTALGNRVSSAEVAIDGLESEIALKADTILLEGYVKAEELEAAEARIVTLESMLSESSITVSGVVSANQVSATYGIFSSLTFGGSTVSKRAITMGSISTAGTALSAGGALDLSHSHAVSIGSDGTITLGEVSSTGGSFNIADTKFYKDGVSAARIDGANSVTLTVSGWQSGGRNTVTASNGKSETITLPPFSASGGDTWVSNKTTVYFHTGTVSGPLASKEVDASSVYSAGSSAGFTAGYDMAISGAYLELDGETVKCYGPSGEDGPTLDISGELETSYNTGWNECRDNCSAAEVYTISENSPGTLYIKVGEYYSSVGSSWVKVSRKYGVYYLPAAK